MSAPRSTMDVGSLPDHAFGHSDTMWWGTLAFIVVEGTTLAVCLASYFYLAPNFNTWPPERTPPPGLALATVNVVLVLLTAIPNVLATRAAERLDEAGMKRWLLVLFIAATVVLTLRGFEFTVLGTHWGSDAYGSVVWATLVVHTLIVLTDWADTLVLTGIFFLGRAEMKHFVGGVDNAVYWWFVIASWVVTYAVIFLAPRVL